MAGEGGADVFVPFLLKHCSQELVEVLRAREPDRHYGVAVSLVALADFSPGMVDVLKGSPRTVVVLLEEALQAAQQQLAAQQSDRAQLSLKLNVHARLIGTALLHDGCASELCPRIADIAAAHIDHLITFSGTVVKTGLVKALEARRMYECTKCKHRFVLTADSEMGGTVQLPKACPSQREKPCMSGSFRHCEEAQLFTNFQELRVQESAQCVSLGAMPHSITVILQDEMAGSYQVGDDVEVTGVVMRQFGRMSPGERCHVGLAVEACSIFKAEQRQSSAEVNPDMVSMFRHFWDAHTGCPMLGRSKLVASMAPQLYGLFHVKLATLLMLIGGVPREDQDGARIRGEVHMLLVGDPGTGKSAFMKFAAKLSPRAVMTTGRTSSAAGLTAAAVQEGAQWTLEAGALVLADGGLCCIDEFDGIRESDSRFDIVLLLLDDLNPEWDDLISDHILESHQQQGRQVATQQHGLRAALDDQPQGWTIEVLRQYIQWVRQHFSPVMTQEAEELLTGYYQLRRQQAGRQANSRATVRMLESLVRVSQAHARLMARNEVLLHDAAVAIGLLDITTDVDSGSALPAGCAVPTAFEDDPDTTFAFAEEKLVSAVRAALAASTASGVTPLSNTQPRRLLQAAAAPQAANAPELQPGEAGGASGEAKAVSKSPGYDLPTTITNASAPHILQQLATEEKQIILLVFKIDPERTALEMLKNWAYHLGTGPRPSLLNHTLMVVPDKASFDICRAEGLPVLIDRAFPFQYWEINPWYPEGVFHGVNRYFDVAKHWWGLKVTELGYSVLYNDIDLVVLKDPLAWLAAAPSSTFDVQAQSDSSNPHDSPLGDFLDHPCGIYMIVKEGKAPGGSQMREVWNFRGRDAATAVQGLTPCASTGVWYIQPTPAALAFQRAFVHRMVIMPFLIGIGNADPLRFRLFSLADVVNVGTWERRKQNKLSWEPVILHTGGVNGAQNKIDVLSKYDYWHPERWDSLARIVGEQLAVMDSAADCSEPLEPLADLTAKLEEEAAAPGGEAPAAAPVLAASAGGHHLGAAAVALFLAPGLLLLAVLRWRRQRRGSPGHFQLTQR
ncbi:hypothetical protein N2152v2_001868 [Parachlorella kessleri]